MIHPTAIIDPMAQLADNVSVGPYSVIGPDVVVDEGTVIGSHVVIKGPTRIGKNNQIFQFASIGDIPQDKKFRGEYSMLYIGDHNVIREYCSLHRGTEQGGHVTRVGDHNLFMSYVHIAHDCIVGNHTVFANNASLAGHVTVGNYVVFGGFAVVSQFCRIGAYSFVCGSSVVIKDILPYIRVSDHYAKPYGLNFVGLKRHNFSDSAIDYLQQAYKLLFRTGLTVEQALVELKIWLPHCQDLQILIDFLVEPDRKSVV